MYSLNPSRIWHKVSFDVEYSWFEFRLFLQDWLSKAKEPNVPYYLLIVGKGTDRFMPFPKALVWNETQKPLSWVTNSISYKMIITFFK